MECKRHKKSGRIRTDLVQVMTVSLFIILLAFFILLNSLAVIDEKRKRVAIGSLLESFGALAGGFSVIDRGSGQPVVSRFPTVTSRIDFDERLLDVMRISADARGDIISIPTDAIFEGDGAVLSASGRKLLSTLGEAVRQTDVPVEIIGHSDNQPPALNGISNRELSALRALRILEYLIAHGKIAPARLTAFGWGPHRPVSDNLTRETRALNRRVDIVFARERPPQKPSNAYTFRNFFFRVFDSPVTAGRP